MTGLNALDPTSNHRLYEELAWLWPIVSPPEDYIEETEQFTALLQENAAGPLTTLLHLGCGGGHNDNTFYKTFQVTGVDISEAMLGHARKLNAQAEYLQGDIRRVRLGRHFSAVVALDAIDYMQTEADLRAVFETAYAHLEPGGVFLTYVEDCKDTFDQNATQGWGQGVDGVDVAFVENKYDPDPADSTMEVTFLFLIRQHGKASLETDVSLCGLFPMSAWTAMMVATGFTVRHYEYHHADGVLPVLVGVKPG